MNIAPYIDHTLLKPDATETDIEKLCQEAREYEFATVCVNPRWVSYCKNLLIRTEIGICAVVGFPLGANISATKIDEAEMAIDDGATEIDMVMSIGDLKSFYYSIPPWYINIRDCRAYEDIVLVRENTAGTILKVIIETCLLTEEEKILACRIASQAGADYVKTSTGFSTGGATVEDIILMREIVGKDMGIKASGGIRNYDTAMAMITAGATRLGCSASVAIVETEKQLVL